VINLRLKVLCKKCTSDNLGEEEITSVHMVSRNSVTQCSSATGSRPGVCWILKATNWKHFLPRLLHAVVEDDSDYRAKFFEWFERKADGDERFVDMIYWSVKAAFNLSGTENQHTVNPH
jgi:hypothetical protein